MLAQECRLRLEFPVQEQWTTDTRNSPKSSLKHKFVRE
jgi:hypothetical protein